MDILFTPCTITTVFLQPCADKHHSNQSLPATSTTFPRAVPHRPMDPSRQTIAHVANYSIPLLNLQVVAPQMPPHPSTLYINEIPQQQITQTNFRQTANAAVPNSQTVFTTPPRNFYRDIQQPCNTDKTNKYSTYTQLTTVATSPYPTADFNYSPVSIKLPPIQIPKLKRGQLAFNVWIKIFKVTVHTKSLYHTNTPHHLPPKFSRQPIQGPIL